MEITCEVKESVLLQYGLTFDEISNAITFKNVDFTAGIIKSDVEELVIRSNSKTTEISELENIVIRTTKDGQRILLKDVAQVSYQESEASFESYYNGFPSILLQINKTTEQDLTAISEHLKKYAEEFNEKHTEANFNIQFDFNDMVEARIDLLVENGVFGLILVMVALGLFLNLRLSSWVAFGIPFSFLGMYFLGYFYGMTVNLISLFGMIMVVGILVDDGIVIAENIYAHYEKGKTPLQAAIDGTSEVMASVFTSVLTTMVAFGMLLFVEGMEMMREMAFVVLACLAFSLIEAFLILPSHLANEATLKNEQKSPFKAWIGLLLMVLGLGVIYVATKLFPSEASFLLFLFPIALIIVGGMTFVIGYTKSTVEKNVRKVTDKFLNYLRFDLFGTVLKRAIRKYQRYVWLPLLFLAVVLGINFSGIIGNVPFPEIKPDQFTIEASYKPGENRAQTKQFLDAANQVLLTTNQEIIEETGDTLLKYYSTNLGYSSTLGEGGLHAGEIRVFLNTGLLTPPDTLLERVARRVQNLESARLAQDVIVKPEMSQFGAPINFIIKGKDNKELKEAKSFVIDEMRKLEGVKNVKDKQSMGRNEIQIKLKPEAEIYQISNQEITKQIRQGFYGQEAQRVIIGTDEVKIWVRYPKEDRKSWTDLENMKIKVQDKQYALSKLVKYETKRGIVDIKHYNGKQEIRVEAELENPDAEVPKIIEKVQKDVLPAIKAKYPQVEFQFGGQQRQSADALNSMMIVLPIILFLITLLITLAFRSLPQALLVMSLIPIGVLCAMVGHGLEGKPVSLLSLWGILALAGIIINDAVVFLDKFNRCMKEGLTLAKAVHTAGVSRFRPILLTSITTVVGLGPIIAEKSFQAQFLVPMAISIAYGIAIGTFFILFIFPVMIMVLNDIRRFLTFILKSMSNFYHSRPNPYPLAEEVEPAVREIGRLEEMEDDLGIEYEINLEKEDFE